MSTTPTSADYDELIATQQIKLKEAQKIVNDGFESAYATLREYQNKMAVVKVEEADAMKKREEGLKAWEAKLDQIKEELDQMNKGFEQKEKALEQETKELDEREKDLVRREEEVEKLESEFVVVEKGPERDKSIGHQDKSFGEQMSLEERIALGRRLEQVMQDLTKDDDLDEDQETDFQPGSAPPKSRVDSVAPANPPSKKQEYPDETAKLEPATEDSEPNFVYLTENVAGVTRVGTRDGIEELLLHGKRFKRMGVVTETMRVKVARLARHKQMHWQARGSTAS